MKPPMPEPPMPVITPVEEFAYLAAARRRRAERLRGGWVNTALKVQAEQANNLGGGVESRHALVVVGAQPIAVITPSETDVRRSRTGSQGSDVSHGRQPAGVAPGPLNSISAQEKTAALTH